jgi:ABC-type transport system substrate-binding protein
VDFSPDGKTWTFTLRPKLRFSDGTPLDARAVKVQLRSLAPFEESVPREFPVRYYADMLGGFDGNSVITDVDAPAPRPSSSASEASVHAAFCATRDCRRSGSARRPRSKRTAGVQSAAGRSGPYCVAEWVHDDHITLPPTRSGTARSRLRQTVIVRDIPDQSTSVLSMKRGDIDMLIDPRPDDARDLARNPASRLYQQRATT